MTKEKEYDIKRLVNALEEAMIAFEAVEDVDTVQEAVNIAQQAVQEINFSLFGDTNEEFDFDEFEDDVDEPDLLDLFD